MDANGTRFHLLLGRDDWGRCTDARGRRLADLWRTGPEPAAAWDGERAELTLRPELFRFPAARHDRPPRLADRRGAGRDRHGSWYWVEETNRAIVVWSVGSRRTSRFWPPEPGPAAPAGGEPGGFVASDPPPQPAPPELSGLAVTEDHYLVAGVLRPAGLLVFDLQAGGPPTQMLWPPAIPFHPSDIAARPGGGVFVLDAEHLRAWALDRHLRVEPLGAANGPDPVPTAVFQPADGSPVVPVTAASREVVLSHAVELAGAPVAVEAAPGGGLLVLQRDPGAPASTIRLYRPGRPPLEAVASDEPLRVRVVGHDMALTPAAGGDPQGVLGTLFVAERAGNQAFGFRLRAHDDALEAVLEQAYYPMRRFGGKALVGAGGRAWYDFPDGWAPLVRQPRSRYLRSATLLTPVLDGREPGCVWHRLVMDACLPPGTAVAISSVAADEPEHLAGSTWRREPTPVARPGGPELPFATAGAGIWTSYELLLQRARGRYLQLRLELTGNQSTSPRLRALRVHYPRFSYLERYLPGVYREDASSASFLDRFLANLEGVSTEIEDRVAAAQVLFDPAATPAKALEWLAGWFGVALDPRWDEPTRRLFIANAMEFFRHRGTIRGVELALRLALGPADQQTFANPEDGVDLRTVRIVETFKTRRAPGVVFGDPTDLAGPRLAAREPRWRPAQGGEELSRRYRARLDLAGIQVPAGTPFPVSDPGGADAPVWQAFAEEVLGFVPDAGPTAARLWPGFLARRYSTVGALNLAHGGTLQRFQDATPPARLPADGPALADWFTLQSVVLPVHRKAHRFTVLLPVRTRAGGLASVELRELARRVVALQKPAQTLFDVRFFWSAFRVGEARLGRSTVIESGSRAPELFAPAVLGREYLGEAHLGGPSNLAYQEAP